MLEFALILLPIITAKHSFIFLEVVLRSVKKFVVLVLEKHVIPKIVAMITRAFNIALAELTLLIITGVAFPAEGHASITPCISKKFVITWIVSLVVVLAATFATYFLSNFEGYKIFRS